MKIAPEVAKTLEKQGPVVALESTLVTHGFPWPENLAIARDSETAVRDAGAVPATIAVIDGVLRVGLDDDELAALATPRTDIVKATTRDLPLCVARRATAGTTVAATMVIAARAGIRFFATGGIGGVHRGVSETWDISADMTELGRTPVCVVCSGAKSLLDLPKTLEVLETLGVPVIGYRTDEFPAFYTHTSGLKLDARADTPASVAAAWRAQLALGMTSGMIVANPLDPAAALPREEMEKHIADALAQAQEEGIAGKATTPFILRHLVKATEGRTLAPNKALIRANARLAGEIARAFSSL